MLIHFVVIMAIGILSYSNTFNVPLQWDDKLCYLAENPIVKDLKYFVSPSEAKELKQYGALKSRYIGYLTFAINYKLHGLDVWGYHVVNNAVHILNALMVYLLVVLTFQTPLLMKSSLAQHSSNIALFAAVLFVGHPVQTEAVTYIFQRLASLAAFFYLSSILAYSAFRMTSRGRAKYVFYFLSLLSAVLAMKTKENAFTLPLAIALYELVFFSDKVQKAYSAPRVILLVPLLLTMLIIPLSILGTDMSAGEIVSGVDSATRGFQKISRPEYFYTQSRVIVTYMRIFFLPYRQNINYDYKLHHSLIEVEVLLSLVYLACILACAIYMVFSRGGADPAFRFAGFGIIWFFLALSVESSVIPLPMVINEYRVYLPSVGFFISVSSLAFLLLNRLKAFKYRAPLISALIVIPVVMAFFTYSRNNVWRSEVSLWLDTVNKSPGNITPHINLGVALMSDGHVKKAERYFRNALNMRPENPYTHNSMGVTYAAQGLISNAISHFQMAAVLDPDFAEAYVNLGRAYNLTGYVEDAIQYCEKAVELLPHSPEAHYNLALAYERKGYSHKAREHYRLSRMYAQVD